MGKYFTLFVSFFLFAILASPSSFGNVNRSTIPQFSFSVPVDCQVNKGCFIHKYFNRGGSSARDWGCGTNTYYNSTYGSHFGTDIYTEGQDIENRSVLAAADGEVVLAEGGYQFWGYVVIINHGNDFASMYAHLKPGSIVVSRGQQVNCGQQIAIVGDSGGQSMYNYGPVHLHFEARYAPGVDISSSLSAARSFLGLDESYTYDPFQSTCISPADNYGFWGSHPDYGSDKAPVPGFSCGSQNSTPSNEQDGGSDNSEPEPTQPENPETPENNDTSQPDTDEEIYSAQLIEKNIPSYSQLTQSVEISIAVKNTGNVTWNRAKLVKLFTTSANTVLWKNTDPSPSSTNNCNSSSACLSNSETVSEGDTHIFQFSIVAPPEQGKYKFAAQLTYGNEHIPFGPTIKKSMCVGMPEFCGQPENAIEENEDDASETNSTSMKDDNILLSHRIGIAKKTIISAELKTMKNIVQYQWDFGDNTNVNTNAKPTHVYQNHGLYTILLNYEDVDGTRYSLSAGVLINDSITDIANNLIDETEALNNTSENHQQGPKPVSSGCQSANLNDNMYWLFILALLMIRKRYKIKHRE